MAVCPKCGHEGSNVGGKCPYDEYYFIKEEALEDAKRDPMIGTLAADKYVILSLISEGGMGAVYRAIQLPVERMIAFKVLRAELKDSDQGRDRFIREARAVSRLTHPNIITLHDFGFDDTKYPYMVMEYAPGGSLTKWLKQDGLTTERIIHVVVQILSALTDAHNQGIVHRDLKPDNMIITESGVDPDFVKLLDFGIARMINEGATRSLTREGEVFGTPHYMAPEQAQGKKDIGPAADVYAVGIMLFEMLTGQQPFDAPTPLAVLFQHINEPIPEMTPRPGVTIPESLKAIVHAAMAKDPKERYQSAKEMLMSLQRVSNAAPRTGALDAVVNDGVTGSTMPPGSAPLQLKTIGGVTPQFQIAAGDKTGDDIRVYDPDPSIEGDRPLMAPPNAMIAAEPEPFGYQEFEDDNPGVRTGLYIAIGVVVAIIGVLMFIVVSSSDEVDVDTASAEPLPNEVKEQPEVQEKEKVAAAEPKQPEDKGPTPAELKAQKEKAAQEKAAQEKAAKEKAAQELAAKEQAAKEKAAQEQAAKEAAAKKKRTTKKTTKKVEKETVAEKEEPKPAEKKSKTFKWGAKDTRKFSN